MSDKPHLSATELLAGLLLEGKFFVEGVDREDLSELFHVAAWHSVLLSTYWKLKTLGHLPDGQLEAAWIEAQVSKRTAFRALLSAELRRIGAALSDAGITAIALKGARQLTAGDWSGHLRELSDLDLLIQYSAVEKASSTMTALGYRHVADQDTDHHLCFERFVGGVSLLVELHTQLLSKSTGSKAADVLFWISRKFWTSSVPAGEKVPSFRLLAPQHEMIHLALHLALHHFPPRLKWLVDIKGVAVLLKEEHWEMILSEIQDTPAELPFSYALLVLNRYDPSALPRHIVAWAEGHPQAQLSVALTEALFRTGAIYRMSPAETEALTILHLALMDSDSTSSSTRALPFPPEAIEELARAPMDEIVATAQWLTWASKRGPAWTRLAMVIHHGPEILSGKDTMAKIFRLLADTGPWPRGEARIWEIIQGSRGSTQALMVKLYSLLGLGGSLRQILPLMVPDLIPPLTGTASASLIPAYILRNLLAVPLSFWWLVLGLWIRRSLILTKA